MGSGWASSLRLALSFGTRKDLAWATRPLRDTAIPEIAGFHTENAP